MEGAVRLLFIHFFWKIAKSKSGFGLVGVLIAASVGSVVLLAVTQGVVGVLSSSRKMELKISSIELVKEIIATLESPAPECSPPCTWSKSSCTNTLEGFLDNSGTEVDKDSILSSTTSVDATTSSVLSTDTSYNGVYIKKMKLVAGATRDNVVTFRIWVETDVDREREVSSPETSRFFDAYVLVEYDSPVSNRIKNCKNISSNLSSFSGKACPSGQYLSGFDNFGMIMCSISQVDQNCPSGQVLSGFDSSGNKVCKKSQAGQSCPSGQVLSGFNSSGNKVCKKSQAGQSCPSGQYLKGFNSSGNKICLNKSNLISSQTCPAGQYLGGFDSRGNKVCRTVPTAGGGSGGGGGPLKKPHCKYGWSEKCQRCKNCVQFLNGRTVGVVVLILLPDHHDSPVFKMIEGF